MNRYSDRLATFAQGWPHANPTPAALAAAGFYYLAAEEGDDTAMCHYCDKELGGWAHGDDPVIEHHSHSKACAWAIVCNERRKPTLVPTGAAMNKAREATFVDWPHEKTRGFVGKVKKMAKAGWHHVPSADSPDAVECLYCGVELDGWEAKDDPIKEHEKRAKDLNCAFFVGLKKGAAPKIKEEPVDVDLEMDVEMDAEPAEARPVEAKPARVGRGRRTASGAQKTDMLQAVLSASSSQTEEPPAKKKDSVKRKLPKSKARTELNIDKLYEVDEADETSTSVAARHAVPVVLQSARKKRKSEEAVLDPPTSDGPGVLLTSPAPAPAGPAKRARRQRTGSSASTTGNALDSLLMSPVEEMKKPAPRGKAGVKQKAGVSRAPLMELVEEDNGLASTRPSAVDAPQQSADHTDKENVEPATARGRGRKRASSTASNASARSSSRRNSTRRGSTTASKNIEDIIATAAREKASRRSSSQVPKEASSTGSHRLVVIDESQALQEELRLMASSIVKIEEEAEVDDQSSGRPVPSSRQSRQRTSRASRITSTTRTGRSSTTRRRSSSRQASRNIEEIVSSSSYVPSSSMYTASEITSSTDAQVMSSEYEPTSNTSSQQDIAPTSTSSAKPSSAAVRKRSVSRRGSASAPTLNLEDVISIPSSSVAPPSIAEPASTMSQPSASSASTAGTSTSTRTSRRTSSRRAGGSSAGVGEPLLEEFLMLDSKARPRAQRVTGSSAAGASQRSSSISAPTSSSVAVVIEEDEEQPEERLNEQSSATTSQYAEPTSTATAPSSLQPLVEEAEDVGQPETTSSTAPAVPEKSARDLKPVGKGRAGAKPAKRGTAASAKTSGTQQKVSTTVKASKPLPEIKVEPVSESGPSNEAALLPLRDSASDSVESNYPTAAAAELEKEEEEEEVLVIDAQEWERRVEREIIELADDTPARPAARVGKNIASGSSASRSADNAGTGAGGGASVTAWEELDTLDLYRSECLPLEVVSRYEDLTEAELDMTVKQWLRFANQRQVDRLCAECEGLINTLLLGGQKAKAAIMAA